MIVNQTSEKGRGRRHRRRRGSSSSSSEDDGAGVNRSNPVLTQDHNDILCKYWSIDHFEIFQWIVRLRTSHILTLFFILTSQLKHWKHYKAQLIT